MKSNGKTPDQIARVANDRRLKIFLDVFKPLYDAYESELRGKSQIDFNDMINQASDHFNSGRFKRPYKYILVDEFQDTSVDQFMLLEQLTDFALVLPNLKVVAVAPGANPLPVTVTLVPPSVGPLAGLTLSTLGRYLK